MGGELAVIEPDKVLGVLLGDGSWRKVQPGSLTIATTNIGDVDAGLCVSFVTQDAERYTVPLPSVQAWRT